MIEDSRSVQLLDDRDWLQRVLTDMSSEKGILLPASRDKVTSNEFRPSFSPRSVIKGVSLLMILVLV